MGNKVSIENESEENRNKRIYRYEKILREELKNDISSKRINFQEYSSKIYKIERFIKYC